MTDKDKPRNVEKTTIELNEEIKDCKSIIVGSDDESKISECKDILMMNRRIIGDREARIMDRKNRRSLVKMKTRKQLGIEFKRKCSCDMLLSSRHAIHRHRRMGHSIPIKRYPIKKLEHKEDL